MSSVSRMMAKFNTAAPLPTPENFARSKRDEKVKEARAIQLSRQRAAAYNMTLRALAIQATMRTKRNEEEDRKAREDARQKASNFRMNTATKIKKGSKEEREIRAVHAMLSQLAVGDNAGQDDDQLSTIPESARNSNSAKTVRTVASNLHDDVVKEAEKQLNHQALVSFMQENYPDRMGEIDELLKEFEGREDVLFEELTAKLNEELAADKVKRSDEEKHLLAERMEDGDLDAQADLDALEAAEKQECSRTAVEDLEEVAAEAAAAILSSGGISRRSDSFMSHASSFSEGGSERSDSFVSKASSSSKRSSTSRRSSSESKRSSTSKRTSVSSRKSSSRATPSIAEAETVEESDNKSRASSKTSKASNKSFARAHSGRSIASKQSSSFMSRPRGSVVGVLDKGVELRQVIHSFYSVYAPEKLDGVASVIEHFRGRERDLFATLELKYDVSFSPDGSARPNHVTVPGMARGNGSMSSSRSRLGSKSSTTRKSSSSSQKSRSSKKGGGDDESESGLSLPFVEAAPVVTSKFAVDVQSRVLGDRMKAKGQSADKVKAIVDSSGPMM